MNSYHLAILQVTSNGRFPELCDMWRNYHPTSVLSDCEYFYDESCRFAMTTQEEEQTGKYSLKKLYVPVTRKVSDTDVTNDTKMTSKVSLTDETKAQKIHSGMIQK